MRYYFDTRHGSISVPDHEGELYLTPEEACTKAIEAVREIVAASIKRGSNIPDDHMDVGDETAARVLTISYRQVIQQLMTP